MSSYENMRALASKFLEDSANLALLKRVSHIVGNSVQEVRLDAMREANENWDREATLQDEEEMAREQQVEELQLNEEEAAYVNLKRHRNNEASTKIEAIDWARNNSIHSAAKQFGVGRNVIKSWMGNEHRILQQMNSPGGSKRKRLDGGGRPLLNSELEKELANWIPEMRENKKPVSRRIIRNRAADIFRGVDIKISNGCLEKFLNRNQFVLRRVTTTAQKPPENYAELIAKFIVLVENLRKEKAYSSIFAMDETAVWFECPDNRCIDTRGASDVTIVTTGHEKMRITVCLTARSDGKKLLP